MMRLMLSSIILILFVHKVNSEFTAAVVEYYPVQDGTLPPDQLLLRNMQNYAAMLSQINQTVDIVVFPESTLNQNANVSSREEVAHYAVELQDTFDGVSLCDRQVTSIYLYYLACSTRNTSAYLVVNLIERAPCLETAESKCSPDGWNLYNTNIVLDRNRALVAKYRKYNLFGEYYMNQTATPDITIFETDFGVKFGVFTCFDILFRKPALELVKEHGIKHIIYPTMWFSELPFLTALQAQQQFVQETDTVFLSSGANDPTVGSGGTGIFFGKAGPIIYDIIANGSSNIYIAKIPPLDSQAKTDPFDTDTLASQLDNFYFKKDDLKPYTSAPILASKTEVNEVLCSGDDANKLCCRFAGKIKWDENILQDGKNHYQYHLVAFSGVRSFSGVYNGGVEICGVVACINEALDSCGERFEDYRKVSWPATFTEIAISANFTVHENRTQFPNSLLSSIRPLPVDHTEWSQRLFNNNTTIERTHLLKRPQDRLMTFAIYGRDFTRDGPPTETPEENASSSFMPVVLLLVLTQLQIFM